MSVLSSLAIKIVILGALLVVGLGIGIFFTHENKVNHTLEASLASVVLDGIAPSEEAVVLEKIEKEESVALPTPTPKQEVKKVVTPPKAVPLPPPVQIPDAPFSLDSTWRDAVVNILCYNRYKGIGENIFSSGSGVIIDPRGVIITNAHVVGDFLFANWPNPSLFDCSIRIGSPATPEYRAELLYLPEGWNNDYLASKKKYLSYGDLFLGKKDYALLYITKTTDPTKTLPASFPYLPINLGIPVVGSYSYIVGYGASFLGTDTIWKNLTITSSGALINSIRPIKGSDTEDVLVMKGVTAGQYGSSGSAVITTGGKLTAMPTFFDENGQGESTADGVVNAITMDYVSRDLKNNTGYSLLEFIGRDSLQTIVEQFRDKIAEYRKPYVDAWKEQKIIIPGNY